MITVCMVVKNEGRTLGSALDKLCADEFIGEVLVSNHNSDDQTEEIIAAFVKNSPKVRNVVLENPSLNERILSLLNEASTDFVQIRTPHDLYDEEFYSFHYRRLSQNEDLHCSFSRVINATTKMGMPSSVTSWFPLDLSPPMSSLYKRLADPNFSSCGFVAKRVAIRNAWNRHAKFGRNCDWLVKKELSHATACVISFKTLSFYEDRIPSKVQIGGGHKGKEFDYRLHAHCFDSFWLRNNYKIAVDYEPKWYFLINEYQANGTVWAVCYLKILILSYLKWTKRLAVRLFQRSTS